MSDEQINIAAARLTARFPRWKPVIARTVLGLAGFFFFVTMGSGLADLATAQTILQTDSSTARPQAKSEQERTDFNTAYALTGAAKEEAAAIDFSNRYPTSELRR